MNSRLARFDDADLIAELEARSKQALRRASETQFTSMMTWQDKARLGSRELLAAQMRVGARP